MTYYQRMVLVFLIMFIGPTGFAADIAGKDTPKETLTLHDLGASKLAAAGFVDVTAAPFLADPNGQRDATAALQRAINFARDHQMVCFFPPGEYLVSDTLECEQFHPLRRDGRRKGTRDYPCVLVGSRLLKRRPRIILAPHSPGFENPGRRKYVVHFYSLGIGTEMPLNQLQPNISMNQMFIGIDITIGAGNRGAVAIRHRAAQGSGVQDCTIDATHGFCGLEGGAGSGGSHANVTVIGGRIGVDLRETQPAPTICGFTLINQTATALISSSRQTLCAVGLRIEKRTPGAAIVTRKQWGVHRGQLCLVDSQIVFHDVPDATAIDAQASLYLDNVFVRGCQTLVKISKHDPLPAEPSSWTHIRQYACGISERFKARKYGNQVFDYTAPIYCDGKRLDHDVLVNVERSTGPPKDLQSRHIWDANFPSWESAGAVNVKQPPYNAKGDGKTDDSRALQQAIDHHDIVFLPKGTYAVGTTLQLRPNTKLIGLHRCFTWIVPLDSPASDFHNSFEHRPVIATADDANAETVLAQLGIRTMEHSDAAFCLHWQCGSKSIFRAVNIKFAFQSPPQGRDRKRSRLVASKLFRIPLVVISNHGGGRWYNFHQESSRGHGRFYRHLLVRDTEQPLRMYQCNPEHARSQANMELRNAKNVSIYGVKGEYYQPIVEINGGDHIRIFGYGGNAAAAEWRALFVVRDVPNFLLANLVDSPRMPQGIPDTFFAGDGVDPRRWFMVRETLGFGDTIRTQPLERPVLYQRGKP